MTATAFVAGSVLGGMVTGGLLGLAGAPLATTLGPGSALAVLAAAAAAGVVLDAGPVGLPSLRRQVDERWLRTYRGWVYGAGFGFQLGAGLTTIVTTSAVYVAFAAAALSGAWRTGALIGLAFGLARAWTLAPAAGVHTPAALMRTDAWLQRWERPMRRAGVAAVACVAVAAALAVAL